MTHPTAAAHEADHEIYARQHAEITVLQQDRRIMGSCNVCSTINTNPNAYTTVTEIRLRSVFVRLCPSCLSVLKKAL